MSAESAAGSSRPKPAAAWALVGATLAFLFAANVLFSSCTYDCSDSGGLQALMAFALLTPFGAGSAWHLWKTRTTAPQRRVLGSAGVLFVALILWLLTTFVG